MSELPGRSLSHLDPLGRRRNALDPLSAKPFKPFLVTFWDDDDECLGGAIIVIEDDSDRTVSISAIVEAHRQGCNPGGIAMVQGPMRKTFPETYQNHLLSEAELVELGLLV